MKKILVLSFLLLFTGCFKSDNPTSTFLKKVNTSKNYYLEGTLEIMNREEVYTYDVKVGYEKEDKFRCELKNKTNDHIQIILKNEDGVYVLTPSLNKSFKFQSDWPYNGSQSYLLQAIVSDIENDTKKKIEKQKDKGIIITKVNYANNPDLETQKIYLNKDGTLEKVEVYDKENTVKVKMTFKDIDYHTKFDKDYFDLDSNISSSKEEKEEVTSKLDEVLYPMFLPVNTYLESEDKIENERVILTFKGEKPFTLIQEPVSIDENTKTISTFGEPELLLDTIGVISSNSVSWISNGVEYYLMSDALDKGELRQVVDSISSVPLEK